MLVLESDAIDFDFFDGLEGYIISNLKEVVLLFHDYNYNINSIFIVFRIVIIFISKWIKKSKESKIKTTPKLTKNYSKI